jgi:hypothetical protein
LLLAALGLGALSYLTFIKLAFGASIGERPLLQLGILLVIIGACPG